MDRADRNGIGPFRASAEQEMEPSSLGKYHRDGRGFLCCQTGRIPNRSGMTTVAFQGQGGGLPAAEWTLASVLKTGGHPEALR